MNRDPFTEQIALTPEAVEILEKLQQEPGVKVNANTDRLKEGERIFKETFIDTEYPTVEDEEKLRKLWQAKAFAKELEVLPYKETQENLAKNVFITPEDQEVLDKIRAKVEAGEFDKEEYTTPGPVENTIYTTTGSGTLKAGTLKGVFPSEPNAQSILNIRQIVDFGLTRKSDDKDEDQMTCTITCKMTREWMERFLRFLDVMQKDGIIGHSETLSFFADGDGTFRPKFTVTEFKKED